MWVFQLSMFPPIKVTHAQVKLAWQESFCSGLQQDYQKQTDFRTAQDYKKKEQSFLQCSRITKIKQAAQSCTKWKTNNSSAAHLSSLDQHHILAIQTSPLEVLTKYTFWREGKNLTN